MYGYYIFFEKKCIDLISCHLSFQVNVSWFKNILYLYCKTRQKYKAGSAVWKIEQVTLHVHESQTETEQILELQDHWDVRGKTEIPHTSNLPFTVESNKNPPGIWLSLRLLLTHLYTHPSIYLHSHLSSFP